LIWARLNLFPFRRGKTPGEDALKNGKTGCLSFGKSMVAQGERRGEIGAAFPLF